MTPFILTVLKIAFLALLYFFVYRAIRVAIAEVSGRRAAASHPQPAQQRTARPRRGQPRSIAVVSPNGKRVASHRLGGTIQIGRADGCQIRLDDSYVSQFHARIFSRNGTWFVEDLGSTNGTYLNQRKVTSPTPISPGDRVKVGKVILEVRR